MSRPRVPGLSRRAVLVGVGAAGASLGAKFPGREPGGLSGGGEIPTVAPAGYRHPEGAVAEAATAINSAWTYQTFGYSQFFGQPNGSLLGVDGTSGLACTSGAITLYAPLHLPQGAILREAAFFVYNSSPTIGLSVGVTRLIPPSVFAGGTFAFTSAGAGSHVITLDSNSLDFINPIDNLASSYALSSYLQPTASQFGLFGCRLAWEASLGMNVLNPQVRKLDTRVAGPLAGKIGAGAVKTLSLAPEVPTGAKAVLVNLTITGTEATGYLGLYPAGTTWPGTSSINWGGVGQTLANNATVAVSPANEISIICGGPGTAKTHVIVDLIGYYI